MDFRILGPLEVRDDGRPVELRSHKQRALLALLLLRIGDWQSSDALIDALWGERPPETARFALRNHIAGLRRALGTDVIVSYGGGYQLEIDPEEIDFKRFERLVEDSRACEGPEQLERLQEGLALWRGPALADLVYEPFAAEAARRLEEVRADALEELVDAELALGAGPELVERLEALVAEHPYRERLRGQLMLALYRSGRQVDALACYRQTRQTLVEELGIEPGSALCELEQAILRHDPSLEPRAPRALPPLAERREIVTVLVAELRFPGTLDPEILRQTSPQALGRVRTVLESYGAATEQRASDELMGVFGLPRAHEDDALRAARAALELQCRPAGVELLLAIESGEVLAGVDEAGHGFVSGAVVPAARRLLERTRAGEVLVGPLALALLGETAVVHPGPGAGARLVRLAEPVQEEAPLAGRAGELATLHAAFSGAAEKRTTRLFLLVGEAGIGKTRLAAELTSELEGQATIARGRCLSYGQALSYWPLVEVLRSLGEPAEEALELLLTGGATSPQQLAWSVEEALARAAVERPLLVVLDDVHWAEPALLELLDCVCELSVEAPILLLCLGRPELLEQQPGWKQEEILLLEPLPRPDAEALLDALTHRPLEDQRERVLSRGNGNPLFLEELSTFLAQGGDERQLPPRIQMLLQARLDLLPEPQRTLLATAALEGSVFHRGALEALLPEELRSGLSEDLAALTQTLLIRPAPAELEAEQGYRFRHQLIRDTAFGALPKSERARLHERFADWLAPHSDSRAELDEIGAYHLEQAALTKREIDTADLGLERRAADALATAATRAQLRADPGAAARFWSRSLRLRNESDPRVPELHLELGRQLASLGQFDEAEQQLWAAEERATDPGFAAVVRLARLEGMLSSAPQGVPAEIRRQCADAIPLLERCGDSHALALAWHTRAWAEWVELQVSAATHAFEEAAAHAHIAGDRRLEMDALASRTFFRGATVVSYATAVREGERLAAAFPGEPEVEMMLGHLRAFAAFDDGCFEQARRLRRRALAVDRRAGYTMYAGAFSAIYGWLELLAGNVGEAERLVLAAIDELERHDEHGFLSSAETSLAAIRLAQGEPGQALELADAAMQHGGRNDLDCVIRSTSARARAHAQLDAPDEARRAATRAVRMARKTDSLDHQAEAECVLAETLAAARQFPEALRAAEKAASLWRSLDRRLRGAYVAELIAEMERATAVSGVPTPTL